MSRAKADDVVKFLNFLLRQGCTHRFSWPRTDNIGRYYQVCLACGKAYEYDWEMMRRTNRLLVTAVQTELHGRSLSH